MATYNRVMLKLSGEMLGGKAGTGLDREAIQGLAEEVGGIAAAGVELAIVIGGGNFMRGAVSQDIGIERSTADYMGMLATVMNAMALQCAIEKAGYQTRVLSAIEATKVAETYIRRRALRHMEKGRVVILAGGTGNPYFTTDTAAALRATELDCEVLLKATKVDGVYSADPMKNPDAKKYDRLTYETALRENLNVMDATAFTLCSENDLPIIIFSATEKGNALKAIQGDESIGSLVMATV